MSHKISEKPWKSVGAADIFTINSKKYLCIGDYDSKFPVMKQMEGFSMDNLIRHARLSFQKMGCPVRKFQTSAQTLLQKVQELPQKAQHSTCSIIIIQPPGAMGNVFITDKVNTIRPWTTNPSCTPVQQTSKRPTAKIQQSSPSCVTMMKVTMLN